MVINIGKKLKLYYKKEEQNKLNNNQRRQKNRQHILVFLSPKNTLLKVLKNLWTIAAIIPTGFRGMKLKALN